MINYKKGNCKKSLDIIETSRTRYLIEEMTQSESRLGQYPGIEEIQKKIGPQQVLVEFSKFIGDTLIVYYVTRATIVVQICNMSFFHSGENHSSNTLLSDLTEARGMKKLASSNVDLLPDISSSSLKKFVEIRAELQKPSLSASSRIQIRKLYDTFIGSKSDVFLGKKEIVVVPDGVFNTIPFETMLCNDGESLVQKFNIRYTPSLWVSEIIKTHQSMGMNRPGIAFGAAQYETVSGLNPQILSEKELRSLRTQVTEAILSVHDLHPFYAKLGIGKWSDLLGTERETRGIKTVLQNLQICLGSNVEESTNKSLSQSGDLKKYSILHFATHGIFIPEVPELSGLVLSQLKSVVSEDDGYLTQKEISELALSADFVCLSACETGKGATYEGEGLVNLTHPFFVAGAKSICVSTWSIADEATSDFMIEMYRTARDNNYDFGYAISETKRRFIRGTIGNGRYKAPYCWAAFEYFGN